MECRRRRQHPAMSPPCGWAAPPATRHLPGLRRRPHVPRRPGGQCRQCHQLPLRHAHNGGIMTIRWYGLVAPEDVPTGDRRIIGAQALDYRDFPLPGMWQRAAVGGHDNAVVVASWDRWYAAEGGVWAQGTFLDPNIVPQLIET